MARASLARRRLFPEAGISRRPGDSSRARLPLSFRALLLVALEFAKRDLFRNVLNNLVLDPPPKFSHGCLPQFDSLSSRLRIGWPQMTAGCCIQ